jgi:hypothetical protein
MKTNPQRFPWVKNRAGKTLDILSTFGDATRDADAKAFAALMRHIRQVDGKEHTVLMMQVENEVGIRDDSRDRSPAANEAFAKPVPKDLMNYLMQHKDTLAPELREVWAANGNKTSGTWEEVFGPGKPTSVKLYSPDLTQELKDILWRKVSWASDEFFMAWRYIRPTSTRWLPPARRNTISRCMRTLGSSSPVARDPASIPVAARCRRCMTSGGFALRT